MNLQFKIHDFEGPLDLLLHLIKQQEVDIWDISITEIIDQYLLYIKDLEELHLEIASEYLEMAAELIELKSRMLLPNPKSDDDEYEEDPRVALINRLIEYRKYKEASAKLNELSENRKLFYTKIPSDLTEIFPPKDDNILDEELGVYDLLSAFQKMLKRLALQKPLTTRIAKREVSIEGRIIEIRDEIRSSDGEVLFSSLIHELNKEYVVVSFLAILELARKFEIELTQNQQFDDIIIKAKGVEDDE